MKFLQSSKKNVSVRKFLYILPFMIILGVFAYYPLYGWVYAFFDYTPPIPLSKSPFVGFMWFKSLVENSVKVDQILQVIMNTFGMSGLNILFSWLPMIFAIFLNEIRSVPSEKSYRRLLHFQTSLAGCLYIP